MPDIGNAKGSIQLVFKIEGAKSAVAALKEVETHAAKAGKNVDVMASSSEKANLKLASIGDAMGQAMPKISGVADAAKRVDERLKGVSATAVETKRSVDQLKKIKVDTSSTGEAKKALEGTKKAAEDTDSVFVKMMQDAGMSDTAISNVGNALHAAFGVGAIAVTAAKVGEALHSIGSAAVEADGALAKLSASTGATKTQAEQYEDVMLQIKADNFGETYDELADAMGRVVQTMGEMDPEQLRDVTEAALTLEDTFGSDFNETLRGVDNMMKSFGIKSDEAFDLLAKGSQEGLDKSGELGDNMAEYAQVWAEMGFSAKDTFKILDNGLQAGAYNLDKVNDFMKEFGISLKDGRMEENVNKFSKNTQKLFKAWKDGRATTKDVFSAVVADLKNMGTNSTEAATLASDMWSALGEDNAMSVITSLDDVNHKFDDVKGAMDDLKNVRYDSLSGNLEKIGEGIKSRLVKPIQDTAIPALTALTGAIASVFEEEEDTTHTAAFVDGVTAAVGEAQTAVSDLKDSVDNAFASYNNEIADATKIQALTTQLMSLNSITNRNATQQAMLKTVVEELGEYLPEVTDAWDDHAGKLNLTAEALDKLTTAAVKERVKEAEERLLDDLTQTIIDNQLVLDNVEQQLNGLDATRGTLEKFADALDTVYANLDAGGQIDDSMYTMLFDNLGTLDDLLTNGGITMEDYADFLNQLPDPMQALATAVENGNVSLEQQKTLMGLVNKEAGASGDALTTAYNGMLNYRDQVGTLNKDEKDLKETQEEANGILEDTGKKYNAAGGDAEELTKNVRDAAQATREQQAAEEKAAKSQEWMNDNVDKAVSFFEKLGLKKIDNKEASDDLAKSEEELAKEEEEAARAAEEAARKQEESARRVDKVASSLYDSYHGTYEKIKGELMNFDMSQFTADKEGEWEAPETVDSSRLAYNLIEYGNYLQQYKDNMRKLQEELGEDDPFYQHLVEMGPEYSGVVQGLIDGTEDALRVAQSTYNDIFEETDQTAKQWAAEQTALAAAMGQFGSSSIDYSNLRNSVSNGFAGASEAAKSKFNDLVDYCQGVGAQIPDDLALGIQAGTVSVEDATAQMQDQLYGQLVGMRQIAQDLGIALPAELATGITANSSSADMADAVAQLYQTLTGANVDVQSEMEKKASEAGQGMTSGLNKEQETIRAAASANVQAALGTLTAGSVMFTMAGSANGKAYAAGLSLTEPDARRAGDSLGAAFADAMEQAILQRQEQIRLAVSSLVGSGELSEQITLETGNDAGSIGAAVGEALARTPMKTTVSVEMQDGDVVMDGERVGRHVAPTVSRVLAQRV